MSYQAESQELLYSDPEAGTSGRGSHKYYRSWHIWDDKDPHVHAVVFQWGRVGSNGQSQAFAFATAHEADSAITKKVHSKQREGYIPYADRSFDVVPTELLAGLPMQADNGRSQDRIQLMLSDIDRCRRLAMSTSDDVVDAITLRNEIREVFADLSRALLEADGQMEIIQSLLTHKLESV